MYSQFRSFIVVAVVSMFAVSAISALVVFQREVSAYTPRGRILINGNGDFTQANGVTQGSGTSSDPYIIEGWEIDLMMESGNGIDIRNTDAHFIIRDVSVSRGMMHYDGIFFYNVSYGNVENAELSKNNRGVCLSNSTDVAVVRSVISSHVGESIYISQTQNVSVNSNTVFASRYAIYLFNSTNVEITANKISNKRATILAHYSNNITLFANDFSYDGGGGGIFFEYMDNVTIAFNNISDSTMGARLVSSTNLMIMNNNISRVEVGIDISEAANVTIADHTISSLNYAFILHSVKNATIENNFLFNNTGGATIYASSSLRIIGNEVSYNNRVGIGLYFSTLATIKGNTFNNNGIHMRGSAVEQYNSHTISLDNLVNSLPIRYHKDCSSLVVDNIPLGQLIVGNCTDVLATNLTATNTDSGIQMGFVDGATILSNNASSNNIDGIAIRSGTDLTVVNNSVFSNNGVGINLEDLSNVIVSENNICCSGGTGVYIMSASGAKVSLNNLSSNDQGVYIGYSESSAIVTNDVFDNDCGVNLGSSSNITVMDNDIVHGWDGMYVYDSTNSTIDNNVISYNGRRGIHFLYSSYNTISSNIISYSGETGIYLFSTVGTRPGNNTIYHNSIVNNTLQAFDNTHLNQWDDGYPSGGNYWSDYAGVDLKSGPNQDLPGSDSIGDTPYEIDFDSEDRYPLMSPTRIPRVRPPALLSSTLNGINFENVMITWSLSPDDGREFKSVIGYNIHRGTTYDTMGAGYGLITSLPNGTTEFSDDLAGEGDPNNYFYQVCALDLHNDTSCSPAQAGKFTCQLSKGPNLLSVPLIQSDYSVEAVLQTIKWEKAWIYDSYDGKWKWNVRFKPYVGEFHKLNLSSGIWVDVNDNSNFTVGGIVPSQTSILLCRGWNLVGYPSFSVQLVSEALLGVSYKVVEGFEPAMPPYYLRELSSSDPMSAGEGYWIELSGDSVWIVRN